MDTVASREEKRLKQAEKLLSRFRFYIFSGNGDGFRKKTELKQMRIWRKREVASGSLTR
jgi:hypothetical protein